MMIHNFVALVVTIIAFSSGVLAILPVSLSGRYLYTSDGNRFFIKGVAYQEQGETIFNYNFKLA
jgi:1,3-beta-glucanosyltransferase GAS1